MGSSFGGGTPVGWLSRMIAEMFLERDWEGEDAPDMKKFVEDLRGQSARPWATAASPHEAVSLPRFDDGSWAALSVEQFDLPEFRRTMENPLLWALLWGLDNPERLEAWYSQNTTEYESMLPLARKSAT